MQQQGPHHHHHSRRLAAEPRRSWPHHHLMLLLPLWALLLPHLARAQQQQQQKQQQQPPPAYYTMDLAYEPYQYQQQPIGFNLEEPPLLGQQLPYMLGPAVDLVALNRRRFELDHDHATAPSSEPELRRAEMIESQWSGLPETMMANLPDHLNKQLLEQMSKGDSSLGGLSLRSASDSAVAALVSGVAGDDPDHASIERLTKSCLTVHASSSRPEELNVTFLLYTRNNPHIPYLLGPQITRHELIKSSPFDPRRPLKWITHGFHTNVDKSEWMVETKDKVLAHEDSNVILTDWRRGASPALAFYPKAAANAHVVAKMIVNILRRLRQDLDFSRVHLIGHSLGAHIMGFVGSTFTEEYLHQQQQLLQTRPVGTLHPHSQHLIGRITACDPALPCFGSTSSAPSSHQPQHLVPASGPSGPTAQVIPNKQNYNLDNMNHQEQAEGTAATVATATEPLSDWTPTMWTHLRPDSAVVVEVMHSNPGVMGYAEPLGDYDFYPNGFERQPGCGVSPGSGARELAAPPSSTSSRLETGWPSFRSLRPRRQLLSSLAGGRANSQQGAGGGLSGTFDRLIKPIRDFFHGYTCSHHRSVEYMVEAMYYELVAQDRKLDKEHVCQMVGYRCSDYAAFKRGYCFRCATNLDCRTFTMSAGHQPTTTTTAPSVVQSPRAAKFSARAMSMAKRWLSERLSFGLTKRMLPTFNPQQQNYLPPARNKYYFDTKHSKDYCAHHYHLLVKYRWFRVRNDLAADGLRLLGTLHNVSLSNEVTFNRFNYQSYTLLLSDVAHFLGQIEGLLLYGDRIRAPMVEHIEVTYMSNLDARVRSLGSAKLCRSMSSSQDSFGHSTQSAPHLFVRCSGPMV